MIIDQLNLLEKYTHLHPGFKKAVDFIESNDLDTLTLGETTIDESLRIIVIHDDLVAKETSIAAFECHNKHIDIQIILEGSETIGWKPRNTCLSPKGEYNAEKDVLFFNDDPDMYFQLHKGQFGIYFPNDVHAPMIGVGRIKKIVMKLLV
jgi:YhcH/YjgK/YiaL family protein